MSIRLLVYALVSIDRGFFRMLFIWIAALLYVVGQAGSFLGSLYYTIVQHSPAAQVLTCSVQPIR